MAHGHEGSMRKRLSLSVIHGSHRRGGIYFPPDYTAYPGKSEAFIPNFLLKEWMVGVVVLVGILGFHDLRTCTFRLSGQSERIR